MNVQLSGTIAQPEPVPCSESNLADAVFSVDDADGALSGRCSLWWSKTPSLEGRRVGYIGKVEAAQAVSLKGRNAISAELLDAACRKLADVGCQLAIGPIDGSTWHNYRAVTVSGAMPPFFLEPKCLENMSTAFQDAGFSTLSKYYSTMGDTGAAVDEVKRYKGRLKDAGVTVRALDMSCVLDELSCFYDISVASFAGNFLYQEITRQEFMSMYRPLVSLLDPRLVLIAEVDSLPVGFMLFVPDMLDGCGGKQNVIAKTAARLPLKSLAGLGSLLLLQGQQVAAQLGYRKVIHALMHENNSSLTICKRYGTVIREYGLFQKRI